MAVDTETRTERTGQETAARRGTDEGEMVEINLYRARRRSFVDHDVDTVVLHRRIEILLDDRTQTMDLVDEQHVVGFQTREQSREVTGFVEHRTGSDLKAHTQFIRDDIRERRLTQSRRAEKQHMIQTLTTQFGSLHEDLEVGGHLALAGEVGEA